MLVENISYADEVWVVSKGAGANLRSLGYEGRYVVMRNGVDFEKGKADEKLIRKLKDDYHISDDKPVYLFVGRMMWYKGIRIILDALNTLKIEGRDYQMVFVGDGVEKKQIEDYVRALGLEDKCIFTGAVRERDVLKGFYSLADLFLFPSTFDTNGIVVSEAAASGLASVLIKDSCAAEEVTDGRNAFLIEEESNSLTRTLLDLGNDKELFRTIGQNAMDDLYVSWEESVDNAYKRYQIVQREFSYQRPGLLDDRKLTESMITMMADLATGLDLVQRRNEEFENRVNAFLDRWL